jgi:hypothetical protein
MKDPAMHAETDQAASPPVSPAKAPTADGASTPTTAQPAAGPRSLEEAETLYVAARDAWTAAMRTAASGRPADLASLAIAQEAFEAATAERERWLAGGRVAIPVEPTNGTRSSLETAVGQELAWREVLQPRQPEGFLARMRRRLFG